MESLTNNTPDVSEVVETANLCDIIAPAVFEECAAQGLLSVYTRA